MGKTASEKRSAGARPSRASDGVDASAPSAVPDASAAGEPAEPLERARLLAEVARQRVRIAKEELKRARKRVKEAKREAKRARKQADAARKAWKKARKAHRANSPSKASARTRATRPQTAKGPAREGQRKNERKSTRRRRNAGKAPKSAALKSEAPLSQVDGSAPANPSSET